MKRSRQLALIAIGFAWLVPCVIARADVTSFIDGVGELPQDVPGENAVLAKRISHAKDLIAKGLLSEAAEHLEVLRTHPEVSDVDVVIADLLFSAGRGFEAQQWLERASAIGPQRVGIYLSFAELAVRQRRWFDGWALTGLAERIDPPRHWSPAMKGRVADRLKLLKAICCEGRSDWDQAREAYSSLIEASAELSETVARQAYSGLARSCFLAKDYQSAFTALTNLAAKVPAIGNPDQMMAALYEQAGMVAEADEAYQKSVRASVGGQQTAARLAYARFLLHTNAPEKAKPLLGDSKMPVSGDPTEEAERFFLLAVSARLEGRFSDAMTILSKLHQERPDSVAAAMQLAVVLVDRQDESMRARAMQIAESVVRNLPSSSDAWATLGWVQLRLGDTAAADKSLAESLKLSKPSRDTLYYMAEFKRAMGKTDDANALMQLYDTAAGPRFFARDQHSKPARKL
ncbi:Tetratricopeptide repeat protein [Rubripirellula tenax]|uniref:Tetratricopeptide repeat protein n=1 Tax=Rubripirellula tenax TaxID=2528015 RepID=A0A5C6EFI1_9BACT|nr:tetratricopeptide repeat protein [Rubripirellula tenax]TWU48543.1 Tetratricopeptide repeat protein [Rubripirellula tenax]